MLNIFIYIALSNFKVRTRLFKEEYWKHKNVALKNRFFFVLSFDDLSGKLGPIFKVPCSNNFLFKHYYLFDVPEPGSNRPIDWRQFMLPDLSHPGFVFFFFSLDLLFFSFVNISFASFPVSLCSSLPSLCVNAERERRRRPPLPPPPPPQSVTTPPRAEGRVDYYKYRAYSEQ